MTPFFVLFLGLLGMVGFGAAGGGLLAIHQEVAGGVCIAIAFLILFLLRKAL